HDGCVQVSERRGGGRGGKGVRREVHGPNRGDRSSLRGGDALLEHAPLFSQRRLVTHPRRHTTHPRPDPRACKRVTINVVDEEQPVPANTAVFALLVTEEFGHGQTGQRDAQTVTRRLVHLTVHHRDLRVLEVVLVDNARLDHLVIEVVTFAG